MADSASLGGQDHDNAGAAALGSTHGDHIRQSRIVPDVRAAKDNLVRIIDESGEDYLFDKTPVAFVDFPQAVRKKLLALQRAS